jgi:colanic acid biosynthesis glycosyl transferase WcaI
VLFRSIRGVRVERVAHYIPGPPVTGRKRIRLDASWLLATYLRSLRAKRRPDVMVFIAPPFLSGLLALVLRWRWRVPVWCHVQDLQVDAALDLGLLPRRLGGVLQAIERFLLRRCDVVSTVSHGMRQRLLEKVGGARSVVLWPNWADTAAMRPQPRDHSLRTALAPVGSTLVLYSGNLGRKQGLDVLLKAAALLMARSEIRFVVAGDGAEREELRAEAGKLGAKNVAFQPLVDQARLAEFLSAADMHVIPQRREAADLVMPSKLLNLMAVARPVVVTASAHAELAQVVVAAGCGRVVPPGDPAALAAAIAELAGDAALRQRLGEAGRTFVERHYGIHTILSRVAARMIRLRRRGARRWPLPQ